MPGLAFVANGSADTRHPGYGRVGTPHHESRPRRPLGHPARDKESLHTTNGIKSLKAGSAKLPDAADQGADVATFWIGSRRRTSLATMGITAMDSLCIFPNLCL